MKSTHQSIVEVEKGLLKLGQVEKCLCFSQSHPNVVALEPEVWLLVSSSLIPNKYEPSMTAQMRLFGIVSLLLNISRWKWIPQDNLSILQGLCPKGKPAIAGAVNDNQGRCQWKLDILGQLLGLWIDCWLKTFWWQWGCRKVLLGNWAAGPRTPLPSSSKLPPHFPRPTG